MEKFVKYVVALVVFSVLDFAWIASNYKRYNDMVEHVSGNPITLNYFAVMITYILLLIGLFYFVLENIDTTDVKTTFLTSIQYAGVLGFVVYGVYSFTNLSIFKNYDITIAILDTLWGSVLFTLTAFIVALVTKK